MELIHSLLTDRFKEAFLYCLQLHGDDTRKGKPVPYIAHLMSVCALVLEHGGSEDEAIAALLHDALEDHPDTASRPDIRARFGVDVLHFVESCTDTPSDYQGGEKPPWRSRKQRLLDHIAKASPGLLRIALADKLHNARSLLADYRQQEDTLWERFNAGKADQLWFYQSLVRTFRDAGATGYLIEELERVVTELVALCDASPLIEG